MCVLIKDQETCQEHAFRFHLKSSFFILVFFSVVNFMHVLLRNQLPIPLKLKAPLVLKTQ